MRRSLRSPTAFIVAFAVVLTLFVAVAFVTATAIQGVNCERRGDSRDVETFLGGWQDSTCYARLDGRVMTLEQYDVLRVEVVDQ